MTAHDNTVGGLAVPRCKVCGVEFARRTRGHDANLYCSRLCSANRVRPAKPKPAPALHAASCGECGVDFQCKRLSLLCSKQCRAARARKMARAHYAMGSTRDMSERICRGCGVAFSPTYGDKRRLHCSPRCSKAVDRRASRKKHKRSETHRRRARRAGVEYEPFNPLAIFERDGWLCGICKAEVDRALSYPHPMSVSLDHVLPISRGGGHTRDNAQCAHLRCNVEKGASVETASQS